MRTRRLRKEVPHLEITAFINLIVVLVPFLLSTAVFTRLAVMDLQLPAQQSAVDQLKVDNLQLEIVIRKDALEVGDRVGGLIQRIDIKGAEHDVQALQQLMVMVKGKFPTQREATLLAEPDTSYDQLVQVMDAVRGTVTPQGKQLVRAELFPNISVGDAPVRGAAAPVNTANTANPAKGRS
ncbi:biopolymer transporter ExbD [beta proteobacterium AAP121]|nr:biopolymer transporter ExbD [beta proteobacterium AAP65]KPF99759.1 biopolymer transporter ExbD [beta proteobacterium AAP121]